MTKHLFEVGHKHSEETKRKISIANKHNKTGIKNGIKTRFIKGHTQWPKGSKHTKETKEKMSQSRRGKMSNVKGKHWKLSIQNKLNISNGHKSEKNYAWKGDDAGYSPIHVWVKKWKGKPIICEVCGQIRTNKRFHWANIDHKYRRVLEDYISMCVK